MAFTLDDLERIVSIRAEADAGSSYTRSLIEAGPEKCAKKLGEEGVEAALACAGGSKTELVSEAADVLYHLLVALKVRDVELRGVMAELERRTAQSGHAEKAARKTA
ncbi:phosphoribosyl-ATP diphosphatase [Chelatococcus sambhunathii]|uniref:Phosphoribosyl-ATP pyrophosphatase n=1 Tax=Chelatococcus sambhunathii TaxID=363953 RepID=A0ABU1DD31_9HYPH|nr:phosphoribosyl-ATP diphosphatase [Chelatococcus sambhunathii]MDR4305976.1 phosphoribosyl-ATP diphosphatase [Chelatococcus sambhunathii]